MSFSVKWTVPARKNYDDLKAQAEQAADSRRQEDRSKSSKQEGLFKQVQQAIARLLNDPRHPGLNTHEYDSLPNPLVKGGKVFEAYVQNHTPGAYRLFFCYGPGKKEITIIAITPHP